MRAIRRPERFRVRPLREGAFSSTLHDQRLGAWLGIALGVAFLVCFVTGLLSHVIQHPPAWFEWPARPAGLYRATQGIHVGAGIATVPLLLGKLWVVYPHLWTWPPLRSVAHAVERLSLLPLVAGSIFLLMSGVLNITHWFPWAFFFPAAHHWVGWITIGALVVHVGAKIGITRASLARDPSPAQTEQQVSRRRFLGTIAAAVGGIGIVTVGQTFYPLRRLAFLAPRRPDIGPQGFPVNKSALSAGVIESARDPAYRLSVEGNVGSRLEFSLDELRAMPQTEATLPIACVDGWSATRTWRGVRVRDLLERAGAPMRSSVRVESLQARGLFRAADVNASHASDPQTLLALEVNGEPLHIDHGYPVRLIGPNRPGVMQTKWVSRLVVT